MSRYVLHCDEASGLDGLSFVRMIVVSLGEKAALCQMPRKNKVETLSGNSVRKFLLLKAYSWQLQWITFPNDTALFSRNLPALFLG